MAELKKNERVWSPAILVSAILSLPFLYTLSYGPALQLAIRYDENFRVFKSVYMPLRWLTRHCQPLNDLMNWYCNLFG